MYAYEAAYCLDLEALANDHTASVFDIMFVIPTEDHLPSRPEKQAYVHGA